MIGVYEERISHNDWLNEATKQRALKKLNNLSVHVGYPDELPPHYDRFKVGSYDKGSNLILERLSMNRIVNEENFMKFNNKNLWGACKYGKRIIIRLTTKLFSLPQFFKDLITA